MRIEDEEGKKLTGTRLRIGAAQQQVDAILCPARSRGEKLLRPRDHASSQVPPDSRQATGSHRSRQTPARPLQVADKGDRSEEE